MMFTIILYLLSFFVFEKCFAESTLSCPSIASVRQLINIWPQGPWLPLYVDSGELASLVDIKKFSQIAQTFHYAEWSGNFLEMAHCHYQGSANIILARDMLAPDLQLFPNWHYIEKKLARCISITEDDCPYGGIG